MADDQAIRDALKTRLRTITGLSTYTYFPGSLNGPAAVIQRNVTNYDATMADGSDDWEYIATLMVPWADPKVAQAAMSKYLDRTGATSIKAVIEAEDTLGGVVDFAVVKTASEEVIRTIGEVEYLAVDFTIGVTA